MVDGVFLVFIAFRFSHSYCSLDIGTPGAGAERVPCSVTCSVGARVGSNGLPGSALPGAGSPWCFSPGIFESELGGRDFMALKSLRGGWDEARTSSTAATLLLAASITGKTAPPIVIKKAYGIATSVGKPTLPVDLKSRTMPL